MTDSNSNIENSVSTLPDDLDDFNKVLYGSANPVQESHVDKVEDEDATNTDVIEDTVDPLANEESDDDSQTDESDDDREVDQTTSDDEEDDSDDTPKLSGKKHKKSFQERMNEITAERRKAERERDALARRIEELEAKITNKDTTPAPKAPVAPMDTDAPNPDAVDEKGEPLYPLGDYDPKFIRDLTKFTIEQERQAAKQVEEQERAQARIKEQEIALVGQWEEKLVKAETEMPDLREKASYLEETFADLEPNYGKYLAATLMSLEKGPEVLYYLANNISEAKKITSLDPARATIALGRLEARFIAADEQSREPPVKVVSRAPEPPTIRTKGTAAKVSIRPDTDNLDDFEKLLFAKK